MNKTKKDIIVIGTSTGGLEALGILVAGLPKDFPASLFIVRHTRYDAPGILAKILEKSGMLQAITVWQREPIQPGRIYVAAPDRHMLIERDAVYASTGPKENRFRPAVDPLFRSAALAYGRRVIGVVLTGALDDGTAGLKAIKQHGGTAIVQDRRDAVASSMPRSAAMHVQVDYSVPIADLAPLLWRLTADYFAEETPPMPNKQTEIETKIARGNDPVEAGVLTLGTPSEFTCPECHGVLLRMKEEGLVRFRCHTGHAYTLESLLAELDESVEDAIWNALRCVQEQKLLMRHLSDHLASVKEIGAAEHVLTKAQQASRRSEVLNSLLISADDANPPH